MSQILDHVHIFVRWRKAFGEWQYKCADPDCYEVKPLSLILGKRSRCAVCRQTEMILTREDLRRAKPRCKDCSNTKQAIWNRKIQADLTKILQETGITEK